MDTLFSSFIKYFSILWLCLTGIVSSVLLVCYLLVIFILNGWIFLLKDQPSLKLYLLRVFKAGDQVGNSILNGSEDETISSRAGKNYKTCWICRVLCKILNKIDPNHCKESIELDENS